VLAVARRGSFRAAAIELDMSTSALSSAIAGLEARLGVRLSVPMGPDLGMAVWVA